MMGEALTSVEREALALAAVDCVGHYTPAHIDAWQALEERGLVCHVTARRGLSRFYRITDAGRSALEEDRLRIEGGLPPGPWRVIRDAHGDVYGFKDAEGQDIMWIFERGISFVHVLSVPDEVVAAIEALPTLVEAARKVWEEMRWRPDGHPQLGEVGAVLSRLRDALAAIDGGRGDDDATNTGGA